MKPLAILRPEPGNASSVAAARAMGLEVIAAPLFRIVPSLSSQPQGRFDALLAGSANAFRHGGEALANLKHLPVLAVGETTAAAAREAGFTVAATGTGGLQSLLDALPQPYGHLLRLTGRDKVELDPSPRVAITEWEIYAAEPLPPPDLTGLGEKPAVLALHSAEAARRVDTLITARTNFALACIGPRVAAAAGPGWAEVRVAERPDDAALLALAREMCQTDC